MLTLVSYNHVRLLCNVHHWSAIVTKKRKGKPNDIIPPPIFLLHIINITVVSKSD